jgi:hypothetical protein
VTATDPSFDFEELLKRSTQRAQAAEYDHSGLFSLSPLTSLEPSRQSSPVIPSIPTLDQTTPPNESFTPPYLLEPILAAHQPVDRVKKRKTQSHACRSKKRAKERETRFSPYEARPAVKTKYINNATAVNTSMSSPRVARTGYVALDGRVRSKKKYQLHELVGPTSKLGLTLQEWDGTLSYFFPHLTPFLTES